MRYSTDILSLGELRAPLSPIVPLDQLGTGGYESAGPAHADSSTSCARKDVGEVTDGSSSNFGTHKASPQSQTITATRSLLAGSLRFIEFDRRPSYSSSEDYDNTTDSSGEVTSDESPTTDDDDFALRALAFAKMRAASHGMGAAMSVFATSLLSDDVEDEDVSSSRIHSIAFDVISTISNAPPALERHISQFSTDCSEEEELTTYQRDECAMVRAFTKRWAENMKFGSTYWQGTRPLPYKEISIATAHYLTLYKTEQAIRNVSAHLNIPPPLEVDLPEPRLSSDPVHVGLARCVERGRLLPRFPVGYSPQQELEIMRSALNKKIAKENKKVQTVEVRLLAGAKRAAGKQKEAQQTRREQWAHGPSKLRLDMGLDPTGDAVVNDSP
ncbi:hypothetical protein BD310DRAFT_951238 [Dichomitus squalens]|uniref:Uncharacterized protein n=1 Tax=Dichomitus squalens TaxID=114155 RepID=A0A4Q9PKQ3_9APHY|nr:hypothetical protein BD310DRAFT_951238 [Dichomitus squalens]